MMVNFKLEEEMRKDVIVMSQVRDKEKNLNRRQQLKLWPSTHWLDAPTTDLQRTCGKIGHKQGSCMTCILCILQGSAMPKASRV